MTSTSIICVKKDVDSLFETLNTFGEFHVESSAQNNTSLSENSESIQQTQERLFDVDGLIKLLAVEKGSLLGLFKATQPVKVNVTADNWQSLLESTSRDILNIKEESEGKNALIAELREKDAELNYLRKILSAMERKGVDMTTIGDLKLLHVSFARMPIKNFEALQIAIRDLPLFMCQSDLTEEECFVILAASTKRREELERILHAYHATLFQMPSNLSRNLSEAQITVNQSLRENSDKEKETQNALRRIGEKNKDNLASWKETCENILTLLNAEQKILQSGRLATIKGYVPQRKFKELSDSVNEKMDGKAVVLTNDPAEDLEAPPTKIMHNRFIKPFEEITRLYGLPNYEEVDPTSFIAISFPILFGLMFGDLGHGLVLLIGGLVFGSLIKANQGMKNVCWIMAACGIAASVAGLLFGEFFGQQVFAPLWFSPFHGNGVFEFLIFSLCVGIVQIVSGIVIEMANYIAKHNLADAFLTAVPKMAFYLGGVYLIVTCRLDFALWFSGAILAPFVPFIIMVAGKPLWLMATKPKMRKLGNPHAQHAGEHPEQDTFIGRLFEGGDFLTRLLSNTISYSRILALLMAHWALLLVTYTAAELINPPTAPTTIGFIIASAVIVFGNIAVIALESLIVFIHTLRLHFYEWFSKFYGGTGTEFSPFKQKYSYTTLTLKKNNKQ